ncbi:MAG: amidohydrolase family protein [Betaproteobacteria bacterium]
MTALSSNTAIPSLDAHVHLWRRDDEERHWMREKIDALNRDFAEEHLRELRGKCGVGGAILVQAYNGAKETMHWLRKVEQTDQLVGVIGWADLFSAALEDDIRSYQECPKFVGVRPLPPDTFGADWLSDPRSKEAMGALQKIQASVDILLRVENLGRARELFRQFPGLRLVLNHGGRPPVMTGELGPWRSEIQMFAKQTSAVVKCSGLVERAGVEWTKDSVKPYVATLIEAFGTRRVMFATNWPVMTISSTYDLWVRTLARILNELGLSQDEQDDVMWRTASRHYGIPWPPRAMV